MREDISGFSVPRWRLTRWLADAGSNVPGYIRSELIASLFGTLPIFAGGVINTILVSAFIAYRIPQPEFIFWLGCELLICSARLVVLLISHRNAKAGKATPTDIYILLALAWSGAVGYGCFISMMSGDWVVATLACLSAGAMVGGICFRNFGAPRLASVMIILSLGPACLGGALSGEPILYVTLLQIPLYLISMTMASHKLNAMLIATKLAERENERRANEDALTGLLNRTGLLAHINDRLSALQQDQTGFAVLYLDLDGFKLVNDQYGHASGDEVLFEVSRRILANLGPEDAAARIGGDEFVVVKAGEDDQDLTAFAASISENIGERIRLNAGSSVEVGSSMGIALAPRHGSAAGVLLDKADKALYQAKAAGKNRHAIAL